MDDRKIIQLFFARSQYAISELSQKYGEFCYRIAMNILKNREDAEETENDTYLKVWNSIPPACPDVLRAYIGRITRNLSLSRYRYNHREKRNSHLQVFLSELEECIPAPQNVEDSADDTVSNAICAFLAHQDSNTRILFIRRYFYMESISALAKDFGMKESSVSTKLNRVRLKLKCWLEEEGITV
ncbi:MAG: sigma-70 family RNA polymerase sigma factor [Acetatifactor muris]|nr:sigma-70 family RNA polymerase sigma factor [Acetatifactor muris]MCM1525683.1 sigma-70 family RNA polymerase sigma factor [Bacteroides sp.]